LCVCSNNKKKRGFSNFVLFSVCLALEKFCAYIGTLGTTEILVFIYNKIYEEGIDPNETYYRN